MFGYIFAALVGGGIVGAALGPAAGLVAAGALVVLGVLVDRKA